MFCAFPYRKRDFRNERCMNDNCTWILSQTRSWVGEMRSINRLLIEWLLLDSWKVWFQMSLNWSVRPLQIRHREFLTKLNYLANSECATSASWLKLLAQWISIAGTSISRCLEVKRLALQRPTVNSVLINCLGKWQQKFSNGNAKFSFRQLNSFIQALREIMTAPRNEPAGDNARIM